MLDKGFLCSDGSAGGIQVTLQRKMKRAPYDLEVTMSEQEKEQFISELPKEPLIDTSIIVASTSKIAVNRTSKTMVNKFQTTVNELERLFFLSKVRVGHLRTF